MSKIKTSTGVVLDSDYGMAPDLTKYAQRRGLNDVQVFYDKKSNVYLLVIGETPEYESQLAGDVVCYIDFIAINYKCNGCKK